MAGPAGDYYSATWPGFVGVLTAMAPGRFSAAINQAPLWRRTRHPYLRLYDVAVNAIATWSLRHIPPDQLLRQAMEQCATFGFGQSVDSRFVDHIDFVTGAVPAQFGMRTAGIVEIQTKDGIDTAPGGSIGILGGGHGLVQPSFEFLGSSDNSNYYFTGNYLTSQQGIEMISPRHEAVAAHMAGAYAICGDRPAMLRALEAALTTGATAAQVRRDPDFAPYVVDPAVISLLDRAAVPAIPVDVGPHVAPVRAALDSLVGTLRALGEPGRLNPPATLDAVLAAEHANQIQLPNDYRALLTITDGMAIWEHEFFGTLDYQGDTKLARRAREFLEMSVSYGGIGMDECVPLASWGQPNNWLLYDPRGAVREGDPGYVVMLTADPWPMTDLADALLKIEASVRDVLGTN
jgi:hypothetical protein